MEKYISHLASRISDLKYKKVFLLGGPDSGKTTFAVNLAKEVAKTKEVSIIDTDIGQSAIGPPTTVGAVTVKNPEKDFLNIDQKLFFVGEITPIKFMLPLLAGTFKLSTELPSPQIIDSSGLVSYPFGHILKFNKLMAMKPDLVVCFEREDELTPLIDIIKHYFKLESIKVSSSIPKRSPIKRADYRQRSFKRYFNKAEERKIKLSNISVYPWRSKALKKESSGLVIGLNGSNDTLGIGILESVNKKSIEVLTPVKDEIRGIIIGNLLITRDGKQAGRYGK